MATIDTITKIDSGYAYTFSASGVDIWLDGTLLEENYADTYFTLNTSKSTPPEIEICDYGARCTNSWASRTMHIQFFADVYTSYALTEYRSGVVYKTRFFDVPMPQRYTTVGTTMMSTDSAVQYWTVRPAVKYNRNEYAIVGMPIQTVIRRHYLPKPPVLVYAYDPATRTLTIT